MAKKKNIISVNWDEAEGGKYIKNPGEYVVKLIEGEIDTDDEGRTVIEWRAQVTQGKDKGATIGFRNYVTPKTLWKLRDLLEAVGYPVKGSAQDLDVDDILETAKDFVIEVTEGNERADGKGYYMQVDDYMALGDYEKTEEKFSPDSDKEEESTDEEGELDEMEEEIDELGLDIDLDDYDTFEEKKAAFEKAKKKAKSKKEEKPKKVVYTREMIDSLGSAELDKIANEIGLELDEDSSPRSKRRSLIQALKEEGRFEE